MQHLPDLLLIGVDAGTVNVAISNFQGKLDGLGHFDGADMVAAKGSYSDHR